MPDISMCKNTECSAKGECYRYMADPDPLWQSYASFPILKGKCQYFIPVEKGDVLRDTEEE